VSWHAMSFEERLEKALSEEKLLSERFFIFIFKLCIIFRYNFLSSLSFVKILEYIALLFSSILQQELVQWKGISFFRNGR
jgi:hypothetical protein